MALSHTESVSIPIVLDDVKEAKKIIHTLRSSSVATTPVLSFFRMSMILEGGSPEAEALFKDLIKMLISLASIFFRWTKDLMMRQSVRGCEGSSV